MKGKGKVSLFLRVGESKGRGHGLMCEGKDLKGQLFPEGGAYLEWAVSCNGKGRYNYTI